MRYFAAAICATTSIIAFPLLAQEGGRLNSMIAKLEAGEAVQGVFYNTLDFNSVRTTGRSDLDYIIIDMEHHPLDITALRQVLVNLRQPDGSFSVTPIVRIPLNGEEVHMNRWLLKQVLDVGVMGIMVPFVNTADQAREAVISMRYPPTIDDAAPEPRGMRGWSPGVAAATWGVTTQQYAPVADLWPLDPSGEIILIPQIETPEAIENLPEIMAVPGVGALFIGPADLHNNMGYLGQSGVAEVEAEIQRALQMANEAGMPVGLTPAGSTLQDRLDQGFRVMTR
jgi:4-hydroxy-2-oxoheptanedioate aldolase